MKTAKLIVIVLGLAAGCGCAVDGPLSPTLPAEATPTPAVDFRVTPGGAPLPGGTWAGREVLPTPTPSAAD